MRFTIDDKRLIKWIWVKRDNYAETACSRCFWQKIEVKTLVKKYQCEIFNFVDLCSGVGILCDMPYLSATFVADIPTMSDGRDQLSRKFFNSTLQPTSPLHSLLPTPRDQLPITRLRAASKFPRIPTRTKKYQSFLSYALAHYQT